jgi:hypothetical protein
VKLCPASRVKCEGVKLRPAIKLKCGRVKLRPAVKNYFALSLTRCW